MPYAPSIETDPFRTRVVYDRSAERLRIAVDAFADDADVSVAADSSRVRIRLERAGGVYDRTIPSPSHRRFTDDREAVFNNGVLTVTLETAPRPFSQAVQARR
ncbi:Hsp20/alpha crystallin family protein [Natrarchaeobius sp. A-rgal3]|uniref:Hsp20/alpha crystallin family protein n=1 Tax=Natrarchaeobius versutus TaxID=1679078 RepID=UPI00350EE71E